MGLQQPGAYSSFITTSSSSSTSFLFASVASWLLLVSCRIEFCLSHPPPAAAVPSTPPQAEVPPAVSSSATPEVQVPQQRLPVARSSSSKFLVSQPYVSVSQASSPLPPVFQSSTPQFSVSQSHVSVSHPSSPPLPVSQPPSPQFLVSQSHVLVSQSSSPQSPVSQFSSPQFLVSHPSSPKPGPSPFLPSTTHPPAPSRSPQTPKQLYLRPPARLFFTHSLKSGLVSREARGKSEREEENAATDHGGMEERSGGKERGGRVTRRQDTGGRSASHRGTRTRHPKPQLTPNAGLRVGVVFPHASGRLTSEEEEEEPGLDAPWTEKSSHELGSGSRGGDKLDTDGATASRRHLNLSAASKGSGHEEASSSSNSSSSSYSIRPKVTIEGRYPVPLLARGALDLTSGEQEQPEGLPAPAEAPAARSAPHDGAGRPAGLLNVNEMMVNSLKSLEQEYTSEEVHPFGEKSVSREMEGGEERGGEVVGGEEEEEEEEEEESVEEDGGGQPPLGLEAVPAPRVQHQQHLSHPHLHEAEKERQVMLEVLTRRLPQAGPPHNLSVAMPPILLHHPAPSAPPPQPLPAIVTQETHHVETPLAETVTLEPHPCPASPHPPRLAQPPPPLETSPGNTRGLLDRRGNSLDQKSRKENFHDPSLAFTPAPGYKRAMTRPPGEGRPSEGVSVLGGGSPGSDHSAATKFAGSGGRGGAGPSRGGGLRGPTPPGSLDLRGIRPAEPGQRGGKSPAAVPRVPASSSHKWSPRRANESVSASHLHPLPPPASGKIRPTQGKVTHAPPWPPAAASPGDAAPLSRPEGGGTSGGLGLGERDTTGGGKKKEEENITPAERREKNMVEATLVRENGGGNLRPVILGGGGGGGRERERGKGIKNTRNVPQDDESLLGEGRDDEERTSHGVNFAASRSLAGRPQARRRKRLLKRDSDTTAQVEAGGPDAGQQESRGQRPPMAPRGTFQEVSHAAGVPQPPGAAAAPHQAKVGVVDEALAGGTGGPHTAGNFEAPPWVAPVPGAGDPPPRHHVAPGPLGGVGADYSYLPPGFATVDTSEGCQCWQTHDDSYTPEEECRCRGQHITQLPSNLSTTMDRLSLTKMGLETLGHRNLSVYSASIKELILRDVYKLQSLESDVFKDMPQLRTIYISHAPRLVKLPPDVFHVFLPSLKVLRIVHTGLTVLPGLSQLLLNRGILHLLDLENNKIKRIRTASVSIRAIQLLLDNNNLRTVEASAFNGSEIDKLSLKGNPDLTDLHLLAFQGVKSLTSLDLSNTRISRLPTEGLEGLESLHLTGTYELKVFPSVYSFKHITSAHLTYPYHCCAFRYPRLHDPTEHRKHEEFLRQMEKAFCGDVTSPSPKTSLVGAGWRRRRRRAAPASTPSFIPVTRPDTTPEAERTKEQGRGRGQVTVSALSSEQLKRRRLPTPEDQIVVAETIPRSVTSSSPSSTSFRPSLPPLAPPKGTPHTSRLNPSLSEHVKGGKKAREEQTQAIIMSLQGEQMEDEEVEDVEIVEEKGLERRRKIRRGGIQAQQKVNNMDPYVENESGKQEKDVEENLPYHMPPHLPPHLPHHLAPNLPSHLPSQPPHHLRSHLPSHLPPHLPSHLPPRLPRSAPVQHNTSTPRPHPPDTQNWGTSLSHTASSPRLADSDDPEDSYSVPGAPDEDLAGPGTSMDLEENPEGPLDHAFHPYSVPGVPGEDLGPGTSMDLHVHPEEPLDHAFHPYHPGGFADGDPEYEDQGHHVFAPSGGFGDVVVGHDEPHQASDSDQFFHVNEVTVSPEKTVCEGNLSKNYRDVQCFPEPDAFNPCEDIMGNLGLRVAVWVVVVTAVFGNLAVMVVLMSTRFKMTVSKFLMCNLAVADLCMGLYLLIIAAMDLHTIGVYFNSAIYWQNGPGCKVAGFLTVFASELSILTLTVITLERWYAITYAIHLNKRLRLSVAVRVMVLAWIYALTMAALPLIGVSGYSKTSICLPMETADGADQAYLLILLITNGLAFVLICVCYAKMYCSIAGNNLAANTSDTTVAKRMALLVFTDFACWAPIAFFGLTAVCGYPLISVTHAKFLLVFFYPLNSCANPYLYAILTKQYRRDLFLMLARHGFFTRRAMKYKGGCSTNTWLNHHHVCVSGGGGGGGGSGGPSRRISTLTQITTCGEWRGRARDGSEESLPRQASPTRVRSISAELAVPLPGPLLGCGIGGGGADRRPSDVCRRLQPVAEVHDGRISPQAASPQASSPKTAAAATSTSGSPHPIKNCYARMSFTPEQEALLQRYATDRQPGTMPAAARRRPSATDAGDEPVPLTVYTPTTPDTITTPVSPSLDHAV